jgi:phosphonopyruvate decarboxylase
MTAGLDCKAFFEAVRAQGIDFFAGVPDSLLKDFCAYVTDCTTAAEHVITANEGSAVALATGHFLATGRPAMVYLQNSGLGNTVNPLTSLADPAVYGIPMLVLIGWRGEPGVKDEPQHVHMGSCTRQVLDALGVPWRALGPELGQARDTLAEVSGKMRAGSRPVALLVPKGCFGEYKLIKAIAADYPLTREEAIAALVAVLPPRSLVVATTGMPSRELFEVRENRGEPHATDFLTVGSMGHSSQIALGVALAQPGRDVFCLDGDGAVLMHMGGLASIGALGPSRYRHFVVNNGAHDSVGGQPTVAFQVDLPRIAGACGYRWVETARDAAELGKALPRFVAAEGPAFLEVRVRTGHRPDLGRPTMLPRELKAEFMAEVQRRAV